MGEMVEFPSNGGRVGGYLAPPEPGAGPAVIVIQEWWGLVDHVKDVCDRLAGEGFCALAPDLYHGKSTKEPDEAGRLMMAMNLDEAARDLTGAIGFLEAHPSVRGQGVGVVGFCLGGGLALWLATLDPQGVRAVAPFYGVVPPDVVQPDYSAIGAAVQGHYAEHDDFAPPESARKLEAHLQELGKTAHFHVYPGTRHAFFNDSRSDSYDENAARLAWVRLLEHFREHLG